MNSMIASAGLDSTTHICVDLAWRASHDQRHNRVSGDLDILERSQDVDLAAWYEGGVGHIEQIFGDCTKRSFELTCLQAPPSSD